MIDLDKEALVSAIVATLLKVYPENDPRARARRFFPLFAKVGHILTGSTIIGGAVFILLYDFPLHDIAAMLYGLTVLPFWAVGALSISIGLYRLTSWALWCKDQLFGAPSKVNS